MRKNFAILLLLLLIFSAGVEAKKKRAQAVKPLISSGISFNLTTEVNEKGLDVWLSATVSGKNSDKPFHKMVYRISFDPRMENDVQAIYPVNMKIRNGVIRVMDERGKIFKVSVVELTGTGTGGRN